MKRASCALLTLLVTLLCGMQAFAVPLRFDAQGKFKILLIADPQDDQTPEPDMAPLIDAAIRKTQPDLIVVLGDLVENWAVSKEYGSDGEARELSYEETLENCRAALDCVFAPIIASGIPYTAVLGNNDYKAGVTAEDWYALLRRQKGILLPETRVYADGRTDNVLSVCGTDGGEALRLFLLDTGKSGVTGEQVNAFGELNDDRSVPAIVLQHIPVPETYTLWRLCSPWADGAEHLKWFIRVRLSPRTARGEDSGRLLKNGFSRQFRSWKACGNVIGAYFGHVHNVSAEGTYGGLRLGLVYSDRWNGNFRHGCALLTFDQNDVEHYTWTVFRCTGSVTTGDAVLNEEKDEPYPTYTVAAWLSHQWQGLTGYLQEKIDRIFHS